jgi:hypothetical protein
MRRLLVVAVLLPQLIYAVGFARWLDGSHAAASSRTWRHCVSPSDQCTIAALTGRANRH